MHVMDEEQEDDSRTDDEQGELWDEDDEYRIALTPDKVSDSWVWDDYRPSGTERCLRRWPEARLVREFRFFRQLYWPGRLLDFDVTTDVAPVEARMSDGWPMQWWGCCNYSAKTIFINLLEHRSDRQVRSVLLHELCHAAAAPRSRGHDVYFFWEVEKLLAAGAPIRTPFFKYEHGSDVDPDLIDLLPHCAAIRKKQQTRRGRPIVATDDPVPF